MVDIQRASFHSQAAAGQLCGVENNQREETVSEAVVKRLTRRARRWPLAKACSLVFICIAAVACSDREQPHKPTIDPQEQHTPAGGAEATAER